MSACTFFGHRDCQSTIRSQLQATLIDLIEHHSVDTFYVGNQGGFDAMVYKTLKELKQTYPHIQYTVVLAYLPTETTASQYDPSETLYPEGMEKASKRFAIDRRNKWMLQQSEYVVTYVTHSWGGAAKYMEMAEKQMKCVIHLASAH